MNPPYGEAANAGTGTDHKAGIALTAVNGDMKTAKMGSAARQLYAQFMFQCARLARDYGFQAYTVAVFSKPTFMSSGSYKPFRDWWYSKHEFKAGFLFQASHFADVSGAWGVAFTVWNEGKTGPTNVLDLKDEQDFTVVTTGAKSVYNSDGRDAPAWVQEPIKNIESLEAPGLTSGITVVTVDSVLKKGSLAYRRSDNNNLTGSGQTTYLLSSASSCSQWRIGSGILPSNWRRAIALFAARKLVLGNWINDKDEYLVPDETKTGYAQWVNDCHVYALLHPSNNCTAMRNVPYKDGPPNGSKTWTIHNHFFWKLHKDTLNALDTPETLALYRDCQQHPSKDVFGNAVESTPDPYMAHVLAQPGFTLSPDAADVLAKLDDLWTKSLPLRESYAAGRPELHLTAWDASIYQTKHLFRELFPTEWKALQEAWRALGARLQAGVYEYGFLRR
jgi:hypothetical protein